jgi:transcriptional regulator GlxA family with amidase domain
MIGRDGTMHHHGLSTVVVYISRHMEERIRLRDLSAAAGVSARTLGYLFLNTYGTTPMAFVKQERLKEAHRLLERADASTATVAGIARRCGFSHMGQFSLDYKRSIGESPSQTLNRTSRRAQKYDCSKS